MSETQKPWLFEYPQEVARQLELGGKRTELTDETLSEMFRVRCREFADCKAIHYFGTTITYRKLGDLVERFATQLMHLGVQKGHRVALCTPNCPEAIIAYFGILYRGAIVVPCNPIYVEHELSNQIQDAGARVAIAWDAKYEMVKNIPELRAIIVIKLETFMPLVTGLLYSKLIKEKLPEIRRETGSRYRQTIFFSSALLKEAESRAVERVIPDDTAMLQYTGGTTGVPKGAELSHRNLMANVQQLRVWFYDVKLCEEIFLVVLPLFHTFAISACQNFCLYVGGMTILVPKPTERKLLKNALKQRPTIFCAVPDLYGRFFLKYFTKEWFTSVRYAISGGSPLSAELSCECKEKLGMTIVEGYGMSEMSPVSHCNRPDGHTRENSIGLPIPWTDAKIINEDGTLVPTGSEGELCVRGPQVMKRYWNNPEETALVFTPDGWLKTGDVARMDELGYFYIVDRKKDMINVSGFKVYPNDVEKILKTHDAVSDAVVIGTPRGESERVKACIVLKEGKSITEREFIDWCREPDRMSPHKIPVEVEFRAEIPKTILGKPLRYKLRKEELEKVKSQKI